MTVIVESLSSRRDSRDLNYLVYRLVGCLMGTTTLCCCLCEKFTGMTSLATDGSEIRKECRLQRCGTGDEGTVRLVVF